MTFIRPYSVFVVVLMGVVAGALDARADTIAGASFTWQYYADGGALPNNAGSNTGGSFTGGGDGGEFIEPGVESDIPLFNVDSTDTSVIFDYSPAQNPSSWSSNSPLSLPSQGGNSIPIYNGIAVDLTSSGTITSVTIDPLTNMSGFTFSNVGFTDDQIEVDWSGLSFNPGTEVVLDVTLNGSTNPPPGNTPEPGTGASLGFGLAAVCFLARRRLSTTE